MPGAATDADDEADADAVADAETDGDAETGGDRGWIGAAGGDKNTDADAHAAMHSGGDVSNSRYSAWEQPGAIQRSRSIRVHEYDDEDEVPRRDEPRQHDVESGGADGHIPGDDHILGQRRPVYGGDERMHVFHGFGCGLFREHTRGGQR